MKQNQRRKSMKDMHKIVDIQVAHLAGRLAERRVTLTLDSAARDWLAGAGYDPVYGARPLKRVIQRELQNPLASLVLEGKIPDGSVVHIAANEKGLVIAPLTMTRH